MKGCGEVVTLFLTESDVTELLPLDEAIPAVEKGFRLLGLGEALNYPRRRGGPPGATLNVMWAVAPSLGVMGVKSYPVVRMDVPQASTSTLTLYSLPKGALWGVVEADTLGQRRTGAATAVATRLLARPDSKALAVFGAGWQAEAQVEATRLVLPSLSRVMIVNRSQERATTFATRVTERLGVRAERSEPEAAVREADVIVTATGAADPLFDGQWLRPGTHVNAVGSNYFDKRELDLKTIESASVVAVDSSEVARLECGDLRANEFDWNAVVELYAVLLGRHPGRTSDEEVTIFESQGLAIQDLVCGDLVLRKAESAEKGVELPL